MKLVRFDELGLEEARAIHQRLHAYVSAERQQRIEAVLARRTRDLVLVLEDVSDDHNASAVLRTAEALGLFEVHVVEDRARFVIEGKTASGAHKWLDVQRHKDPRAAYQALARRGYAIWASGIHGRAVPIQDMEVSGPVALVFGNEHHGLSRYAQEAAHGIFKVPMVGFVESLNVSVATALSLYEVLGRKRCRPLSPEDSSRLRAAYYTHSVKAAAAILRRAGLPLPVMSRRPFAEMERPRTGELSEEPDASTMEALPPGDG